MYLEAVDIICDDTQNGYDTRTRILVFTQIPEVEEATNNYTYAWLHTTPYNIDSRNIRVYSKTKS
jgi:hypothetical protein